MATKEELVKTNKQLHKELDSATARLDSLDPEAKAYHLCVKALNVLKQASSRRVGGTDYSLQRVVDALQARFELFPDQKEDGALSEPWLPQEEVDPRDIVISQMIDALRRG